jgi:transcriptional regulator with XRE-family HTH domain
MQERTIFIKTIAMHGTKIRTFRLLRGYSQEEMATKLHVTQSTYSRIESGEHKLTIELLKSIAEALDITIGDITSNEPIIIQNNSSNQGAQGRIENFYATQKEVYEKLIVAKDVEIARLSKQVEDLMNLLQKKG